MVRAFQISFKAFFCLFLATPLKQSASFFLSGFSSSGNIKQGCLRVQVTDVVGRASCWKIDLEGDQDQSGCRLCRSKALPPPWRNPESQSQGLRQAQAAGTSCSHQFMLLIRQPSASVKASGWSACDAPVVKHC
jgi:hypothetical protein